MTISLYFLWMLIYSFFGWCFETIYCTLKTQKWENRGFFYGPICPIYGVSAVLITMVYHMVQQSGIDLVWWQVFLIAFFGSMVIEYSTSWTLEKLFHAYWWDYSDMPLNINGRICLPASTLFGLAGLLIIYVLAPQVQEMTAPLPPLMIEALSLLMMAVTAADATLTISALTNFEDQVADLEANVDLHMEMFVLSLNEKRQDAGQRLAEERERFSRENMERFVGQMSASRRAALKRVKGFRPPAPKKGFEQVNRLLKIVKGHVGKVPKLR